ncbi:MAG: hypothetical protein Q8O15_05305 [Rectinemataceae bacterium]|nr:hypothetical protein [Rectinemataceae bacterium]
MNPLYIRIALSFIIAGIWIAAATFLGERLGSRKAGLIANMPSNILISLIFVALTRGSEYAAATTVGVPMGMMIDTVFLAVFIFALAWGLWAALAVALASWALCAVFVLVVLPPLEFGLSLLVYIVVALFLFLLVHWKLGVKKAVKKPVRFSWKVAAVRAFFAGSVVAGAVTIAQVAPPYMTGVLATFPAALTSTLVILTMSQGRDFTQATGKMLILSSCNIIVYTTCAGALFPSVGPWWGTLISFAASLCFIVLLNRVTVKIK